MRNKANREEEKGLSAGFLAVLFLILAGVCAVFFSLGFLVGYNEQSSKAEPASERVTGPRAVPPLVNPPKNSRPRIKEEATSVSSQGPAARASQPPSKLSAELEPPAGGGGASLEGTLSQDLTAPPDTQAEAASARTASREVPVGFAVQVDALRAKHDAEALVKILKARRYPVFLVTPEYSNAKDNLFRVQVGPFKTREDAEKVRNKLSQEGFKPFIKR